MPDSQAPIHYAPGSWTALVAGGVCLFADLDPTGPRTAACWDAANAGAGVDGLLALLTDDPPPGFVLLGPGAKGLRVVVAGTGQAEASGTGDAIRADASGWTQRQLDGLPNLRLTSTTHPSAQPDRLPLTAGVVLAASIAVGVTGAQVAQAGSAEDAEPVESAQDAESIWRAAPSAEARTPADAPRPGGPTAGDEQSAPALPWRTPEQPDEGEPSGEVPVAAELDPDAQPDADRAGVPAELQAPNVWDAPPVVGGYGAASSEAWVPQDPYPAAPDSGYPGYSAGPLEQGYSAVPSYPADPSYPVDPAYPADPAASGDTFVSPTVYAVGCPNQHLNAPYLDACWICGAPITPQDPVAVPRPPLGVLLLSTGVTVPLDRDVLLGRAPFAINREGSRLVPLASPDNDISRTHVRIALDGWLVQVTDLGSTNGTIVTLPGQPPVRLRAHDPFTIVPGTVIALADEVGIRYEVGIGSEVPG